MCFEFHAYAFGDVLTFEYLKMQNIKNKNSFEVK